MNKANFDIYFKLEKKHFINSDLFKVVKFGKCKKCKFGEPKVKKIVYQYLNPNFIYYINWREEYESIGIEPYIENENIEISENTEFEEILEAYQYFRGENI